VEHSQDLHSFLDHYREAYPEDVLLVETPLDADQDITALVWELARGGSAPLVICQHVSGLPVPVVTNVFASRDRVARCLGSTTADLHSTFLAAASDLKPVRVVSSGPVTDIVVDGAAVDLQQLPMITHFAGDAAPYLTSMILLADDPLSNVGNASYHRAMVASRTTLATSLHSRGHLHRYLATAAERGERLPVAAVIGGHPLVMLACASRVGIDVDEREIAGGLFGAPLEVIRTPRYGIAVPATSDFVLEGYIDPEARTPEGPFGEFSGYSSGRSTNNVLTVESILSRRGRLLLDIVAGNSDEHLNLSRIPRESEMIARIKARFPDVTALEYPRSGTHFHCYVSLNRALPGHARQLLLALLGWDPYVKLAVAVDADIDVRDEEQVLWSIATRFQAAHDLIVVDGLPGSLLDPSSLDGLTSRVGIDATRSESFQAEPLIISERSIARARQLLDELGSIA
jgi:2,5-furandicarboxylate decarboxylase 1